jgi:hypothetical protein
MAFQTPIDDITDSVTQSSVAVLGSVPGVATGNLMVATSDALALAAHNATDAQQRTAQIAQASTVLGVAMLGSLTPKKKPSAWYA